MNEEFIALALAQFWSTAIKLDAFNFLPAFADGMVPSTQPFPYLVFEIAEPDVLTNSMLTARIWDRATSFERISRLSNQAKDVIPVSGAGIEFPNSDKVIRAYRQSPGNFIEIRPDFDDSTIQVATIRYFIRN